MLAPFVIVILAIDVGAGTTQLPAGESHLERPIQIPRGARGVTIRGSPLGSILVMDAGFEGGAALLADSVDGLSLLNFEIRGNRTALKSPWYLPLNEAAFANYYPENGIVIRDSRNITVRNLRFKNVKTFPLIVSVSSGVLIDAIHIEDSGTLNSAGRNNTTGGILLEEGVSRFEVRNSTIDRITGNAIWTHSYARSPRSHDGLIRANKITTIGRDAIQVGHASRVRVEANTGSQLGFPADYVDIENHGVAVALDTAGNVDHAGYVNNSFKEVNGQCIDLDGFHDGVVTGNSCLNARVISAYPALHYGIVFGNNDPGMESGGVVVENNTLHGFAYGAVFLIGIHNRIENNRFLNLNLAHCGVLPVAALCNYALDQPDLLRSGIYLSDNGGRPTRTRGNVIRANVIEGYGMKSHCVGFSKGVNPARNTIAKNICSN